MTEPVDTRVEEAVFIPDAIRESLGQIDHEAEKQRAALLIPVFEAALRDRTLPLVAVDARPFSKTEVGVLAAFEYGNPVVYVDGEFRKTIEGTDSSLGLRTLYEYYQLNRENATRIEVYLSGNYRPHGLAPVMGLPGGCSMARIEVPDPKEGEPVVKYHIFEPGRFDYGELDLILKRDYAGFAIKCSIFEGDLWLHVDRSQGFISTKPEQGQ